MRRAFNILGGGGGVIGCLIYVLVAISSSSWFILGDGFSKGNWDIQSFEIGKQLAPERAYAPFHIHVFSPFTCRLNCGEFKTVPTPVVVFVTGYAGQLDLNSYKSIIDGIVEHGIIVVAVDQQLKVTPSTTDFEVLSNQFMPVMDYVTCPAGTTKCLQSDLQKELGVTKVASTKSIYLMTHSSSAAIAIRGIANLGKESSSCDSVKALMLISPFDGQDPFGFGKELAINESIPGVPFEISTLIISGSLDTVKGGQGGIPCVLEEVGSDHYMKFWRGEAMHVEAEGVGHLDMIEDGQTSRYTAFCATSGDATKNAQYRKSIKGSVVNYIDYITSSSSSSKKQIEDESNWPMGLKVQVQPPREGGAAGTSCIWDPLPAPIKQEYVIGLALAGAIFVLMTGYGIFQFVYRSDNDTREDWLVTMESMPLKPSDQTMALAPQRNTNSVQV